MTHDKARARALDHSARQHLRIAFDAVRLAKNAVDEASALIDACERPDGTLDAHPALTAMLAGTMDAVLTDAINDWTGSSVLATTTRERD